MMPMMDVFAPDINFVSARSVYPTMAGGSTASAAGAMSANSNVVVPTPDGGAAPVTASPITTKGHSVFWWLGLVALLILMVFVSRKAGSDEDFRNIKPTMYNFFTIVLSSIVGTVGLKVIFAKFNIPGASDVILAA